MTNPGDQKSYVSSDLQLCAKECQSKILSTRPRLEFPLLQWDELISEGAFLDFFVNQCFHDNFGPLLYHFFNAMYTNKNLVKMHNFT